MCASWTLLPPKRSPVIIICAWTPPLNSRRQANKDFPHLSLTDIAGTSPLSMAPFDFARALAAQTATAAAKLREADEAVRLEAAQKAATATKTREAEEAAHRAKQLQTLSNERAVITNEEAALEEVKQTMLADYNAKIAALKKRAVELDRQANVSPQHCLRSRSHLTFPYRVS